MSYADKLAAEQAALDARRALLARFPSLREHHARFRTVLAAREANAVVDTVEFAYACGCCNDSPLMAWVYLTVDGTRVHSDPPQLRVTEREEYTGRHLPADADADLDAAGLPPAVAERIRGRARRLVSADARRAALEADLRAEADEETGERS